MRAPQLAARDTPSNDARSQLIESCPASKIVEGDNRFKLVSAGDTHAIVARVREAGRSFSS
jgi:hypothetical protein